jgi:hypothetical protein
MPVYEWMEEEEEETGGSGEEESGRLRDLETEGLKDESPCSTNQ